MKTTVISDLLKLIGNRLREQRLHQGLDPEDVAEMTGLTAVTIRKIETGKEFYMSNFVAFCFAVNLHPKLVLDVAMDMEPLFPLSDPRKEKTRLTARIESFIRSDFFDRERTTRDVVNELATHYETRTTTSAVSVILARKVDEEVLTARREGKLNVYKKR